MTTKNRYLVTVLDAHLPQARAVLAKLGAVEVSAQPGGAAAERDELWAMAKAPGADPRLAEKLATLPPVERKTTLTVDSKKALTLIAGRLHEAIDRPLDVELVGEAP